MNQHYKTLGLQEGASQDEIDAAYKRLSKELDPANNDNQEFFKEEYKKLQQAYKALSASSILATKGGAYPTPKPNNTTSTTTNKPAGKDRALNPATHKFKAFLSKYKIVIASAFLFLFSIIAYNVFFVPKSPVYLADNGVTIKAHKWAKIGDEGIVDGVLYTIVDAPTLYKMTPGYVNDKDTKRSNGTNGDLTRVCTTFVTDMNDLFLNWATFNQDIGSWDVSGVNNMSSMFSGATSFNQDIGSWDVSAVNNMESMFSSARSFNQDIGFWSVSGVNNMSSMFKYAKAFNQPIGKWEVSRVNSMSSMFEGATSFNQNLGAWDVSGYLNMDAMFKDATSFNQDIGAWDMSNVVGIKFLFKDATSFNQDISPWKLNRNVSYTGIFDGANSFNQDLSNWRFPCERCTIQWRFLYSINGSKEEFYNREDLISSLEYAQQMGWTVLDLGDGPTIKKRAISNFNSKWKNLANWSLPKPKYFW